MSNEDPRDVIINSLLLEGRTMHVDVQRALMDATLRRTIDGAPTLTLQLHDPNENLVRAGLFAERVTCQLDGKGFELVQLQRQGSTLKVVFEDLAVAAMRKHTTPVTIEAGKMTRLEFARALLDEDGTAWIKIHASPGIPMEKTKVALSRGPVSSKTQTGPDPNYFPKGKGEALTGPEVAAVAAKAGFSGQDLVIAVAVAKAESGWIPNRDNSGLNKDKSVDYGLWQINSIHKSLFAKYGNNWSDPLTNAKMAFEVFSNAGRSWRPWSVWNNGKYKQFMGEAQAAVNNSQSLKDPETGQPLTRAQRSGPSVREKLLGRAEDTWAAIQRIFGEIEWRCYVDWGPDNQPAIYVGPDEGFTRGNAYISLTKESAGVDNIEYDFDLGKSEASMTLYCRAHRWELPPGTWINMPTRGIPPTWLVSQIERSLFSTQCVVSLKHPEPALPEPEGQEEPEPLGEYFPDSNSLAAKSGDSAYGNIKPSPGARMAMPVEGSPPISSPFGASRGGGRRHKGIDFAVNIGTPVYAARDGVVQRADGTWDPNGYGKIVIISHHLNGFDGGTYYAHLSVIAATRGMAVKQGQLIGRAGMSGNATGPCLHFEVHEGGAERDPVPYLQNSKGGSYWTNRG